MPLYVSGGRFRGRKLAAPAGLATRPSTGRMRNAVMNILGTSVAGASVLDLYAGTGASGIEAMSRGARRVLFVENARPALAALDRNIETLSLGPELAGVVRRDVLSLLRGGVPLEGAPFDLVYCDPPHEVFRDPHRADALRAALGAFALGGSLREGATLVIEHPAGKGFATPPPGTKLIDQRAYSAAGVSLFRAMGKPSIPPSGDAH